jgi:integrase
MPVARLSKRTIDGLLPRDRAYVCYDQQLKGFGIRVMPTGVKVWIVEYRAGAGGRQAPKKRVSLGKSSSVTAEQARHLAANMLAEIRLGGDPALLRKEKRTAGTVSEMIARYLAEHVETKLKPTSVLLYRHVLCNIIQPKLGTRKASELTRSDVERVHNGEKDRRPVIANRALVIFSGCFRWAEERGIVPQGCNPVRGIRKFREQPRQRYLSLEEIARLGRAIHEAETNGIPWVQDQSRPLSKHMVKEENRRTRISPHAAAALRLLLLTGARLREILNLTWAEVDLDRGLLFLRDSKTGAKAIVLSQSALELLASIPRRGPHVVMGDNPERPRIDLKRPWKLVLRHAGLDGVRIHDLRHSFASVGVSSGLSLPILGKLLGHAHASTTERYAHLSNDPLRNATNQIGDLIGAAIIGYKTRRQSVASGG